MFGAISPNDGDWYGGVQAGDADEFLTALTEIEVSVFAWVFVRAFALE